jgi:hypothetical protein
MVLQYISKLNSQKRIILGSQSPRRKELLQGLVSLSLCTIALHVGVLSTFCDYSNSRNSSFLASLIEDGLSDCMRAEKADRVLFHCVGHQNLSQLLQEFPSGTLSIQNQSSSLQT